MKNFITCGRDFGINRFCKEISRMKLVRQSAAILLLATSSVLGQAKPRPIPVGPESVIQATENVLFNGWKLTPSGRHVGVNSLPL
jgi:hypothetical protein